MTEQPTTAAGRALLDDIAPSLAPTRCPLSGGEHDTYGGICHCGWMRQSSDIAGRRREGTAQERRDAILAIEAETRQQDSLTLRSALATIIRDIPPAVLAVDSGPAIAYAMRVTGYLDAALAALPPSTPPALDGSGLQRYYSGIIAALDNANEQGLEHGDDDKATEPLTAAALRCPTCNRPMQRSTTHSHPPMETCDECQVRPRRSPTQRPTRTGRCDIGLRAL